MSILDSVAGIAAAALGETVFRAAILHKVGARIPDGRGGSIPTHVEYPCRALIDDYSDFARGASNVPTKDRKALILAGTLDVTPRPGDVLEIGGEGWSLIEVKVDPATALFEAQARVAVIPG